MTMMSLLAKEHINSLEYALTKSSNNGTVANEVSDSVKLVELLELRSKNSEKKPEIVMREMNKVKVKIMNNEIELKAVCGGNHKPTIRKIGGNKYIVLSTGEIKEFKKRTTRGETPHSVKESNRKIIDLIKMNYKAGNTVFVTLTPKAKITEPKQMTGKYKKTWRALRDFFKDKINSMEYLYVLDFGENGGLDIHALWFFSYPVYIPKLEEVVCKLWGRHQIEPAKSPYAIQRYLASHFIAKPKNSRDKHINDKTQRFLESPAGLRRYYPSAKIKRHIEVDVKGETAMDFVEECGGIQTRSREFHTKPFEHLGWERTMRIRFENYKAPLVDSDKIAKLKGDKNETNCNSIPICVGNKTTQAK